MIGSISESGLLSKLMNDVNVKSAAVKEVMEKAFPIVKFDLPIEKFMTPNPETVTADDSLAFALHKMDVGGYRHLPVLQDASPIGVISVRDMLRHITRLC